MTQPDQILAQGRKKIAAISSQYPELAELEAIRQWYFGRTKGTPNIETATPDYVSRSCVRAAILLVRIGQLVAEVSALKVSWYMYRKYAHAAKFNSLKKEAGVAQLKFIATQGNHEAVEAIAGTYTDELVNGYVADYFANTYDDYCRMASMLQSRASIMKSELFNNKQQV